MDKLESLADELKQTLEDHLEEGVSVGSLVHVAGERGFGLLLVLASLPMLVPMPPGTSGIIGLIIVFISVQALVGRETIWLPRRWMAWRLGPKSVRFLIRKALPVLRRVETWCAPRKRCNVSTHRHRWVTAASTVTGLILITPIPFLNTLPAVLTIMLGIGLIKQNSRLMNVGVLATGILFLALLGGISVMWNLLGDGFERLWIG